MCIHNYESRSDVGRLIMYMYIRILYVQYSRYSIALGIVVTLGMTTLYIHAYMTYNIRTPLMYNMVYTFVVLSVCFSFR